MLQLRKFPTTQGLFALRRLDAYHIDTVTIQQLWTTQTHRFPILQYWNPYSNPHIPFLSHAIPPQGLQFPVTNTNGMPRKIQIGDWWFMANFPASWQPDMTDADLLYIPMPLEKIDNSISETEKQISNTQLKPLELK